MHATAFLKQPHAHLPAACIVASGSEAHLKQAVEAAVRKTVLGGGDDAGLAATEFNGRDADWRTVRDELMTVSMFQDQRLVIVSGADDFVSANRAALERYVEQPSRRSVLLLDVKTWRSNTKLAKKIAGSGLHVECSELTGAALLRWLTEHAAEAYGKQLTRDAAALTVELAGTGTGLLDQELAKLSAYAGDRVRIGVEDVRALVGGWKAETTWRMTDAVRDGDVAAALHALGKLLVAGEPPLKVLGGVGYVFRKYARATELSRQGAALGAALKTAGVFPRDVERSEQYLRRIGRPRAERILRALLEADSGLKGASRLPDQLQLELLLMRLAGAMPA